MAYTENDIAGVLEGKNENQQKVIRYFMQVPESDGCFSKKPLMTHQEFMQLRNEEAAKVSREQALTKLNIDASEVSEIEPVRLVGHLWHNLSDNDWWCYFTDMALSSLYQVTWLFFSVDQFYVYQCSFNLTSDFKLERTEEYFYKDVTSFSTGTDSNGRVEFNIVVPGDKFNCAINNGDQDTEKAIQGMKSILRDKKRQ